MARAPSGVKYIALIALLAKGHIMRKGWDGDKFTFQVYDAQGFKVVGDWHDAAYELEDTGVLDYDGETYRLNFNQ